MGAAHRGDRRGVPGRGEPVVHGSPDLSSLDRRLAGAVMAGDEQQHSVAARDRLVEAAVDGRPCRIERQAMEVEGAVGFDGPAAKPLVPSAVERPTSDGSWLSLWRVGRSGLWSPRWRGSTWFLSWRWLNRVSVYPFSRQRTDCRRDACPERGLVRAERAHGRQRPWAPGSAPRRSRTCRRRSQWPPSPSPRRCRTGSAP